MTATSPEQGPRPTLESRFNDLVASKFRMGQPVPGWREHEEELRLLATRRFELCPTADTFRLVRPIPGEEEQARAAWQQYGGPLATVSEADEQGVSSVQSDFFAIGDTMYRKRIHDVPGESVMVPPEALTDEQVADLFDWITTAIPEQ